MASPFRVFRKNVKPMLAFFVVMLMLSWVIGDSLFNYFTGGRGAAPSSQANARAVAVSWNGGKLSNLQLYDLVGRRQILNSFLEQVEIMGLRSASEAGVEPRPLRVQSLRGPSTAQQGVEQSVVQTRLFADAARAAGMHVSDDAIVQYLDELGRGNVTRGEMREILNRLQGGRARATIDEVMATLREEMLARNYVNSSQYAFETVTPEQRWRDWLRVNDRVIVEAAAVPVENYLADVKDPTDAQLAEFFDEYKDREASPEVAFGTTELPSATPGFRIPRKIDLQFIEANYESFLAKAEEKVTDDEIAKYYEAHKDPMFIKADTGVMEDAAATSEVAPAGTAPAATTDDAPPAEGKASDQLPAEPKTVEPKPEDTAPPADPSKNESTPADATKSDAAPPAETPKSDAKIEDGKQSARPELPAGRVFRLAAFQEQPKENAPAADAAAADAEKPAEGTDKPAEPASTPPTEPPAAPPPPPAPPAPPPSSSSESAPPAAPASEPAAPVAGTPAPAPPKKPVEYQSLDEVKDVIRRELAAGKVAEELNKLATDVQGALDADFTKYFGDVLNAQADKKEPPAVPKSLTDLAPLAEKYGLKMGKTGPVSVLQLRELPLGKSSVAETGRTTLAALFGTKEFDLYQPFSAVDIDGNRYIAMKTSDTPGKVPTLAEVRDDVMKAWRLQEAAKLAEKAGEDLAKKARDAKLPLTDLFADNPSIKVARTDPFSELTGGDVGFANGQLQQSPFRLGQPDGIVAPGPDFMKKVIPLKDGEVTVALNHDHSIAYVVRMVEHQMPLAELRTAYLGEANTWPGMSIMTRDHMREVWSSMQSDILAGANLKWERDPDKVEQAETPDAG